MLDEPDPLRVETLAAMIRAEGDDTATLLALLARKLEASLPARTSVRRKGGLFGAKPVVTEVRADIGTYRFHITFDPKSSAVSAKRATVVRDIVVRTEPLSVDAWIESMCDALAVEAAVSGNARESLERFIKE